MLPPGKMQSPHTLAEDEAAAVRALEEIDEMLEDQCFEWAEDTLMGIRDTIERYRRVSEHQQRAITNIKNAGERSDRR